MDNTQAMSAPPETLPADAFAQFNPATTLWKPYNARAMVYAAELAYGTDSATITNTAAGWGFARDRVTVISPTSSVLQVIVMGNDSAVVVAFRGTRPDQLKDWMADFQIAQVPFTEYYTAPNVGAVHDGFARLLAGGWKDIQAEVLRFQDKKQTLWITGHSLGGALALMAASAFVFAARMPLNGLHTFGQPRVGDINFCTQCDSHFGDCMFRFVNNQDIVTRVPPRIVPHLPLPDFYGHCGQLRFFDGNGGLHADDHFWNAFLIDVDVGFANMLELLDAPVADHSLMTGYAPRIEAYIAAGAPPLS